MSAVRFTPLGGVGRFGRNCLLVEDVDSGDALVVDCGVRFAGAELPGFDAALPDLERLASVGRRLKAYVITHGHEDHIGALPYAYREVQAPIFCTSFTARFIERRGNRLNEKHLPIDVLQYGEVRKIGVFSFSFCAVSHSIPGAASLLLHTPAGTVVHSGDFRVDTDPVFGLPTDLATLDAAAGDDGVLCLLADSTGATLPGRNPGEKSVEAGLEACFFDDDGEPLAGRVVVALFASHLQRLALLVQICRRQRRRLLLLGTGLKEALKMGLAEGVIAGDDVLIDEGQVDNFLPHRLCVAVTGSQGEPRAMLSRLAFASPDTDNHHRDSAPITLEEGDRVVFSARVIPGNELKVQAIIDALIDRGVDVISGRAAPHVSGHGHQDDLRQLMTATRPRTFVALHGNPQNLSAHGDLARGVGLDEDRIIPLRDGHSVVVDDRGTIGQHHTLKAKEPVAIDGDVCMFPRSLVQSRLRLGVAGVLVATVRRHRDGDFSASAAPRRREGPVTDNQHRDVDEEHAGLVVTVTTRGVFPAVDGEMEKTVARLLRERIEAGDDDDGLQKALGRLFKKKDRAAPELVVSR